MPANGRWDLIRRLKVKPSDHKGKLQEEKDETWRRKELYYRVLVIVSPSLVYCDLHIQRWQSLGTLHNFQFWSFQGKKNPRLVFRFMRCKTSYSTSEFPSVLQSLIQQQTIDNFRVLVSNSSNSTIRTTIYFSLYALASSFIFCQKVQQRRISPACLRIATSRGAQSFQKSKIQRQNYGRHKRDIKHVPYWRSTNIRSQLKNLWSRDSDSLRAGRSGDRIPVVARFSAPVQTGSWGPPSLLYNGYWVFPGVRGRGVELTTHPYLAPRLKEE